VKPPRKVPARAVPVVTRTRSWDGAEVEFYVLPGWYRSHDRKLDGVRYWQPVAAVARQVLWSGARFDTEAAAESAARESAEGIQ
jgi:hypothetical protein